MDPITMVIGAGDGCDLRVADPHASPRHASITRKPNGTYWIADLGSTNGTRIARSAWGSLPLKIYEPTLLFPGDTIVVGRTQIPWNPPA